MFGQRIPAIREAGEQAEAAASHETVAATRVYGPKPLNLFVHLIVLLVFVGMLQRAAPALRALFQHMRNAGAIDSNDLLLLGGLFFALVYSVTVLASWCMGLPRITLDARGVTSESLFVTRFAGWAALSAFARTTEIFRTRYGTRDRVVLTASIHGPDASPNVLAKGSFVLRDRGEIDVDYEALAVELEVWREQAQGAQRQPLRLVAGNGNDIAALFDVDAVRRAAPVFGRKIV
jgi:hypothetical protein